MPLVSGSIGTRTGADQVTPSCETAYTMSFVEQLGRKRQSSHATKMRPDASIEADGNGFARMPPGSNALKTSATFTALLQVAPPFVERYAKMPSVPKYGTMTVPFGCAS